MVVWVMMALVAVIFALLGYAVGIRREKTCVGTLRLDQSDPDERPYLFLELDPGGMETIQRVRTVQLRVRLENYVKEDPRK